MSASKIKLWVNIVTISAMALLVYISRGQVASAFDSLVGLSLWLLLLQFPVRLLSYGAVAHIYYSYFRNTGHLGTLTIKDMYKVSLELNFINSVFPSGGVSGFSYLSIRLKPYGISTANSTLAQALRFLLTFISFLPLLGLGLFMLAAGNNANGLVIMIGTTVFLMIIATSLLGGYIVSSEQRIKAFTAFLPKAINKILTLLHRDPGKEVINLAKVEATFVELHERYMELSNDWGQLKQPFVYALIANILELLSIYLVYVAFGEYVNPGAIIFAYSIANFAGLIAVVPGGVGVYESLMAAGLAASGVAKGLAISSTIVYRAFNILVFVPIGFALYQVALSKHLIKGRKAS